MPRPRMTFAPANGPSRAIAALIAAGLGWPAHAVASPVDPAAFTVSDAWMRFTIPARPAAGYVTLTNKTDADAEIVGASSPGCAAMMLHETVNIAGVESMRMVAGVRVPAHGSVRFAPGGYHLMCMSPTPLVAVGRRIAVTLNFAGGGALTADFVVRDALGR